MESGEHQNTDKGGMAKNLPIPELDPANYSMTEKGWNSLEIARSLLPAKEMGENLFALEMKGDSMIDAMIRDGDIVVLKPATDARNGELVLAWLPSEHQATLRYYFIEKK